MKRTVSHTAWAIVLALCIGFTAFLSLKYRHTLLRYAPVCFAQKPVAVDGDTIKCEFGNVRIMGMNAPERAGRNTCPRSRAFAVMATQRLSELLRDETLHIRNSGRLGSYNRPLVQVYIGDQTAAELLIAERLAVPYKFPKPFCDPGYWPATTVPYPTTIARYAPDPGSLSNRHALRQRTNLQR